MGSMRNRKRLIVTALAAACALAVAMLLPRRNGDANQVVMPSNQGGEWHHPGAHPPQPSPPPIVPSPISDNEHQVAIYAYDALSGDFVTARFLAFTPTVLRVLPGDVIAAFSPGSDGIIWVPAEECNIEAHGYMLVAPGYIPKQISELLAGELNKVGMARSPSKEIRLVDIDRQAPVVRARVQYSAVPFAATDWDPEDSAGFAWGVGVNGVFETWSGADGVAVLEGVAEGTYYIRVEHESYLAMDLEEPATVAVPSPPGEVAMAEVWAVAVTFEGALKEEYGLLASLPPVARRKRGDSTEWYRDLSRMASRLRARLEPQVDWTYAFAPNVSWLPNQASYEMPFQVRHLLAGSYPRVATARPIATIQSAQVINIAPDPARIRDQASVTLDVRQPCGSELPDISNFIALIGRTISGEDLAVVAKQNNALIPLGTYTIKAQSSCPLLKIFRDKAVEILPGENKVRLDLPVPVSQIVVGLGSGRRERPAWHMIEVLDGDSLIVRLHTIASEHKLLMPTNSEWSISVSAPGYNTETVPASTATVLDATGFYRKLDFIMVPTAN